MVKQKNFLSKLQDKWQLNNIRQVLLVLLVFACTGLTILFIKSPIFQFLGINMEKGGFWKTLLYLLLILPMYQIMLLFYGFIFGQFGFFWQKEKQLLRRLRAIFIQKKK
ncbi:hypothetical protein QWY93_06615 [Echinicola jeungdonensis]|uniref:DUF6787 family protein n=1 Tax=Echinicola jeungdonensis TaxID=709343 RepID=A0ABV5J277_9BACT|nr:DUF6787 family protein [Echinicola jeungdonensis]MDN3668994.1 hypothetical protein [Echinicola jeungdonensis]